MIMDEEHENSYKQETTPRYHAREVAAKRSEIEGALFLMGTATPSLETMHATENGEIARIELTQRIDDKSMPQVSIIDLRRYAGEKVPSIILSPLLMREIENNLKRREGTMILLNRRGFSTTIRCTSCGETEKCKTCQVALTFHQEKNELLCHYCNLRKKVPRHCSSCQAQLLKFYGFGTEKVESEIAKFFPQAKLGRLDADTVKKRNSHESILEDFRERKIDILIGTQMIAKGFDFPHVTLVGVVLADIGLRLPDFRSGERTFQLLTQFAGRAGRGSKPGRVLIQTNLPDHPSIRFAKDHDFLSYYRHETDYRKKFRYPPHYRLINIIIRSGDEQKVYQFAKEVRDVLRDKIRDTGHVEDPGGGTRRKPGKGDSAKPSFSSCPPNVAPTSEVRGTSPGSQRQGVEIIGPAPLPFYKLRGHFRWHVMLKVRHADSASITAKIYQSLTSLKKPASVAFQLDIDPLNIL